jgi:glycosyltransferase involved in cell wall biosynthesis
MNSNYHKVSIIICVYNEEKNIEYVIRKCHEYVPEAEIVVVNDGSTDNSDTIISKLKKEQTLNYIIIPKNKGKSNAMVTGVENAKNEIILFFDADITGISKKHFKQLLSPIVADDPEADMVLGTPSETFIDYRINPFKSLTGERAMFKKDLEPILEDIRDIRFGVETYINLYYQANGKRIMYLLLDGLTNPIKYKKKSAGDATIELLSESKEVALTLLKNYDLITQRVGNSVNEQGNKFRQTLKNLQDELNERINGFLENNE